MITLEAQNKAVARKTLGPIPETRASRIDLPD
jgi:hypothetical protein